METREQSSFYKRREYINKIMANATYLLDSIDNPRLAYAEACQEIRESVEALMDYQEYEAGYTEACRKVFETGEYKDAFEVLEKAKKESEQETVDN